MICLDIDCGIAKCRFDIGAVNAFAKTDIEALDSLITRCEQQADVRLLALTSDKISPNGHPIFCAGANQKERKNWSEKQILEHLTYQRNVVQRLRTSRLCTVCCVNGLALGLGAELCLASDYTLASEKAMFAFPEVEWGIVPGAGGWAWAHGWAIHPNEAMGCIESGKRFSADYARWLGIVDFICPSHDMDAYCQNIAQNLLTNFSLPDSEQAYLNKKIDYDFWFHEEQNAYAQKLHETWSEHHSESE